MSNKVLLMILDGWGNGDHSKSDVIYSTNPEYINAMTAQYPHAELKTDGENVGLPEGQMGNSEVGHLNIGAGRVVYQDLVKINRACRDNSILENEEVVKAFEYAKANGASVHFMGLVSDGGVHSSLDHLFKLCDISKHYAIENTFVHCFMDGRDTDPRSGKGFIEALENHMAQSVGKIASIIGRYYAMDRDKRWERVKMAYDQLVNGVGEKATNMVEAMQKSYDNGVTDEFVLPIVNVDGEGNAIGTIKPNDVVIFFNYRNDRAKELTTVLTQQDMPEEGMHTMPLYYCCMTPYDAKFQGLHILFDKSVDRGIVDRLDELVSHTLVVAFLHGLYHVGSLLTCTFDNEVITLLDAFPALVAVHGIEAAHDAGDGSVVVGTYLGYLLDEALTALGVGVTTIHETMYKRLVLQTVVTANLDELEEVIQRRVYATVRAEAHEVQLLTRFLGVSIGSLYLGILHDGAVLAGTVDFHEILIDNASGTDVEVSYF